MLPTLSFKMTKKNHSLLNDSFMEFKTRDNTLEVFCIDFHFVDTLLRIAMSVYGIRNVDKLLCSKLQKSQPPLPLQKVTILRLLLPSIYAQILEYGLPNVYFPVQSYATTMCMYNTFSCIPYISAFFLLKIILHTPILFGKGFIP